MMQIGNPFEIVLVKLNAQFESDTRNSHETKLIIKG